MTDNNITAGTDGALFVDVSAEETVTDVTDSKCCRKHKPHWNI